MASVVLDDLDRQLDVNVAAELCVPSQEKYKTLLNILKGVFDVSVESSTKRFGPLQRLHINGVDSESIWEEIQTRNRPLLRYVNNALDRIGQSLKGKEDNGVTSFLSNTDKDELSEEESSDEEQDEQEENEELEGSLDEDFEEGRDDFDGSEDGDNEEVAIDDEELDMEAFLDQVEDEEDRYVTKLIRSEKKAGHKGYAEEEDNEDDVMDFERVENELYNDDDDEEVEDGDDLAEGRSVDDIGATAKFRDFFGSGAMKKGISSGSKTPRRRGFLDVAEEEESDDAADDEDEEEEEEVDVDEEEEEEEDEEDGVEGNGGLKEKEVLTSFQKKQRKLKEEIAELEKSIVGQKSWDLRGEVKASDRPENSLLEVVVDVEKASKPAPIVTQEHTNSLEEMIVKRITEQKFDDVVPKTIAETTESGNFL